MEYAIALSPLPRCHQVYHLTWPLQAKTYSLLERSRLYKYLKLDTRVGCVVVIRSGLFDFQ
jgi:hypothetical protein